MKFETLKSGRRKKFTIGVVVVSVLTLTILLLPSMAKYRTTKSIKIAEGTISYKPYDFKVMAMYQQNDSDGYDEIEEMPTSGYTINEEKSYCTLDNVNKDESVVLKTIDGYHTFAGLKKGSKCYLYFDKKEGITIQYILNTKNKVTRTDFNVFYHLCQHFVKSLYPFV